MFSISEGFSTIRHYVRRALLLVYGPAQLDDEHDPVKIEDRRYDAERKSHDHGHGRAS